MTKPKIRPVEAHPTEIDGNKFIVLRDPFDIAPAVVVPYQIVFLMSLMDGTREYVDIQEAYTRQFGDLILASDLDRIVDDLDEHLFLESGSFNVRLEEIKEEYRNDPIRPPACAGATYPEDPTELRAFLDAMFDGTKKAGESKSDRPGRRIRGLLAPHIDFQRGGPVYASTYRAMQEGFDADLIVILGVSHKGGDGFYSLSRKNYTTPFGPVETDIEFVDSLAAELGGDPFKDEFFQRTEHSVELQIPILQYLFDGLTGKKIVPILCGSIHPAIKAEKLPIELPEVRRFVDALRKNLAECDKSWLVIAGVDLAHVGRFFGGDEILTPDYLAALEKADRNMLARIEKMDPEGFFRILEMEQDSRSVCGALPIYMVTELLKPGEAKLIEYRQCVVKEMQNCVTIAGMAIY